jgi:hypothetical protein
MRISGSGRLSGGKIDEDQGHLDLEDPSTEMVI